MEFCAENMLPSSTVHWGQYDANYMTVFNIPIDGASGISGGGDFRRLP